jgi:hypothetical protein
MYLAEWLKAGLARFFVVNTIFSQCTRYIKDIIFFYE